MQCGYSYIPNALLLVGLGFIWGEKQLSPGSFGILTPTRCGPCSSHNVPDGGSRLQISDDIVSDTKTCNMP